MNHPARRIVVGGFIHFENVGFPSPETVVSVQQRPVFR